MFHRSSILGLQNWTVQCSETYVEVNKQHYREERPVGCLNGRGKKRCEPLSEYSLERLHLGINEQNMKRKKELGIGAGLCKEHY